MNSPASTDLDTREAVLKEAASLFAARGYDAVSVREIVEGAGVTKPALYYYFDSKEGVARTLLKEFFETADAIRAQVFETTHGFRDLFETHTREMLVLARKYRCTLAFGFSLWFGRSSLKSLVATAGHYDCKVVAEWIEVLQERGMTKPVAERAMKVFWALLMQELLKVVQAPEWSGCADSMADEMATLVLHGVSAYDEDER